MKKAKERLDAEATHEMTRKQKLDNFWFYYRWWLGGGAAAILLVGMFVYDIVTQVTPDYTIGLVTPDFISEETRLELEQLLTEQVEDRNGDGKAVLSVLLYNMSVAGKEAADPMAQMAAVTRLSADLQSGDLMLMLSNYPQEYQEANEMFAYNDDTLPVTGQPPEDSKLGVPLEDCPYFADFLAEKRLENMEGYRLLKRASSPEMLERKPEMAQSAADHGALFDRLTAQ